MKNIIAALAFIRGNQQQPVKINAKISTITDMDLYEEEERANATEKKYGRARKVLVIRENRTPKFC